MMVDNLINQIEEIIVNRVNVELKTDLLREWSAFKPSDKIPMYADMWVSMHPYWWYEIEFNIVDKIKRHDMINLRSYIFIDIPCIIP